MLAFSTHSVLVAAGYTCVGLTFSPVSSVPAICDTGHEAVVEGIRETPHHLVHAFVVRTERITNTQSRKQQTDRSVEHKMHGTRIQALRIGDRYKRYTGREERLPC